MLYTLQNGELSCVLSTVGAELQSLKRGDAEYLWQGDPNIWKGRSPILFPFVGKLKEDAYTHGGTRYSMRKHGFASRSEFAAKEVTENRAVFILTNEHLSDYPFPCTLEVDFRLEWDCLSVVHRVTNNGAEEMFFSLGAHPGFCCEMGDVLFFPEDDVLSAHRLTEEMLLSEAPVETAVNGHRLVITEDVFRKDALIFQGIRSDSVTLLCKGAPRITVEFGSAPCLGVWAKPKAPYVCIEPWYGCDDKGSATGILSQKEHIQRLGSGQCFRFPIKIIPHAMNP
ncbi:MAG: aldose 1-epimerase family protein [Christensenellales bacterium]|jgi:galactose mutarotase-like enzyme